jgi:hypothetical protein
LICDKDNHRRACALWVEPLSVRRHQRSITSARGTQNSPDRRCRSCIARTPRRAQKWRDRGSPPRGERHHGCLLEMPGHEIN